MLSVYCSIPEAIACLGLNGQNLSFRVHLGTSKNCNKMHIEMKQEQE